MRSLCVAFLAVVVFVLSAGESQAFHRGPNVNVNVGAGAGFRRPNVNVNVNGGLGLRRNVNVNVGGPGVVQPLVVQPGPVFQPAVPVGGLILLPNGQVIAR